MLLGSLATSQSRDIGRRSGKHVGRTDRKKFAHARIDQKKSAYARISEPSGVRHHNTIVRERRRRYPRQHTTQRYDRRSHHARMQRSVATSYLAVLLLLLAVSIAAPPGSDTSDAEQSHEPAAVGGDAAHGMDDAEAAALHGESARTGQSPAGQFSNTVVIVLEGADRADYEDALARASLAIQRHLPQQQQPQQQQQPPPQPHHTQDSTGPRQRPDTRPGPRPGDEGPTSAPRLSSGWALGAIDRFVRLLVGLLWWLVVLLFRIPVTCLTFCVDALWKLEPLCADVVPVVWRRVVGMELYHLAVAASMTSLAALCIAVAVLLRTGGRPPDPPPSPRCAIVASARRTTTDRDWKADDDDDDGRRVIDNGMSDFPSW
jgi:hypothetical protein